MAITNDSYNKAHVVEHGVAIDDDGPFYTGGTANPTGLDLPLGTLYTQPTATGIALWKKFDTGVNDWILFIQEAIDVPRAPILLMHNGTLSNGQKIGYGNLVNDADVVVPFKGTLEEVSFSNSNSSADAGFRFYRNDPIAGNLFFTWSFDSKSTNVAQSTEFASNPVFNRGDIINIYFDDEGGNPSDMTMGLFWKVLPE